MVMDSRCRVPLPPSAFPGASCSSRKTRRSSRSSSPARTSPFDPRAAAPRQHLDRRDHARVGLLLLRRDARPVLPRRPARRRRQARRDQERRLRRHRQRHLEGLRVEPRETAPYSELEAGVKLVVAKSIEKIYRQNAQNIGLLTSTDFGLVPRIAARRGDPDGASSPAGSTRSARPSSSTAASSRTTSARLAGRGRRRPPITTPPRPMTLCEKILARHAIVDAQAPSRSASPRSSRATRSSRGTDVRFSHEYVTPMAESLFRARARRGREGDRARERLRLPRSPHVPRPHHAEGPPRHGPRGAGATSSRRCRRRSRRSSGIKLYGEVHRDGKLVGLRGHLPQQGRRGDRAPRPARRGDRHPHVHGGRPRLLRVRRRLDRHGQRLVHARRARHASPRRRASCCAASSAPACARRT